MIGVSDLPHLNAALNATTLVLISTGYLFIRRKNVAAHRACMLAALVAAVAFLTSYVIYHYHAGATRFTGQGIIRPVYFFILVTHLILAAVVLPLAGVTAARGLRNRIEAHKRIAHWTLPIWVYVSVTGLLVYGLLYHVYPPGG